MDAELGRWAALLEGERTRLAPLLEQLAAERQTTHIFPPKGRELFALTATPPERVCAVILGQDPYHEAGQANGLSFSVEKGVRLPPSLRNIYRELSDDLGLPMPESGDLTPWAEQGVLLLNTVLTVQEGKAGSHAGRGWEDFTDGVIRATNALPQPIVFFLWGAFAQRKTALIRTDAPRLILQSPHPSPLSAYRGFFGSRPFSRCNEFLRRNGQTEIDWCLSD